MRRLLPMLIAAAAAANPLRPASADELGRLFLTPEQRVTLDARRNARVPDRPAVVVVESPSTHIDGQVVRSSGRSTVWVDGRPLRDGASAEGVRVLRGGPDAGRVRVEVGGGARQLDVKVGQTINRDTAEVRGLLNEGGSIEVRRPAAPRR